MRKFRNLFVFLTVIVLLGIIATAIIEFDNSAENNSTDDFSSPELERRITILHSNDIHGQIIPQEAFWLNIPGAPPKAGGMAKLGTYLNLEREAAYHEDRVVLYMDGGDWFTGTPESDLLESRPMIAGFNAVGLDYTTLGNHEFDVGIEPLKQRLEELEAPVISSNVRYQNREQVFPGTEKWKIVNHKGIRIGIFGLVYEGTPNITLPETVEGVIFLPEAESAEKAVNHFKNEDVDLIVGITHIGLDRDRRLAERVDGIDVIVGGHSHTRLVEPELVNNTIILQAGSRLSALGRLDLRLKGENLEIESYGGGLITLYEDQYPADPEVAAVLKPYLDEVEETLAYVVGRATGAIRRDPTESSPLGNLITDAIREAVDVDFAFQNAFGIRDNLPGGDITRRHLFRVLPFQNHVVELEMTGEQVRKVFEQGVRWEDALLQLSGAEVEVDWQASSGSRVKEVWIGDERLDPEKIYHVATSNFLAEAGDDFTGFKAAESRTDHRDLILWEILENYFENHSPVEPPVGNRYRNVEDDRQGYFYTRNKILIHGS